MGAPTGPDALRGRERSLAALRQLASVLGARMLEEESDDVAAAIVDVASRRGTHLHPHRPLAPGTRPRAPARAAAAAADGSACPASTCGSSPIARSRRSSRSMSAASIFIIAAVGVLLGIAAGYWLPPHGRLPARNRPRPVRAHPAPVHRPGDLAPLVRGRRAPRQGRERDHHAGVPRARADEPAVGNRPAGAVRERDAAARVDRAALSAQGSPSTRAWAAGAPLATRCANCSTRSTSTASIVSADEDPARA